MKINQEILKRALQTVSKVVAPNPVMPLYLNVLLEATESKMSLVATNFQISVRYTINDIEGDKIKTAIPAKLLTDLVSNFRDTNVALKYDEKNQSMEVKTKNNRNNIKCVDPSDFVEVAGIGEKKITIGSTQFKEAVNRVSFTASVSPAHAGTPISGILLTVKDDKLIMFGVDGFHLSYEEVKLQKKPEFPFYAIVPVSSIDMISRVIEGDAQLQISVTENQIMFKCDNIEVNSQLIAGTYPDYNRFKPVEEGTEIFVSTEAMFLACKQLELFTEIAIKISVNGMLLTASAFSKELGNSELQIVANVSGKPVEIGMNVQYLKQILSVCPTQEIAIKIQDNEKPVLFRVKDKEGFYHIIMPFNLNG